LPFTRDDNEQLRGVSRRESLVHLLKSKIVPEETMQEWMQRKNEYYIAYLDRVTPYHVLPGVSIFLEEAKKVRIKLGIGSASKNAKSVIEKLELMDVFDVIGDGFSVVNPKPAPDLFVWVAGALGVLVHQAIVFEDAQAGIDAAKAAGCYSVGVGTANVSHADIHISSFLNVSVDEILSHLLAKRSNRE
jgi:beta-phosphoglucomutase